MTKQEIINAAFKVWGREFYQSTSLAQLAHELGVSKPALYRHFKNKQALLDSMYTSFFNAHATFIKPQYDKALAAQDPIEGLFIMIRIIVEYFIRHREGFFFFIVQIYGNHYMADMIQYLLDQGIDMRRIWSFETRTSPYPSLMQLSECSLSFAVGYFHRPEHKSEENPPDQEVNALIASVEERISRGFGLQKEVTDGLDYEKLEALISRRNYVFEDRNIFKAVAEVVAESGLWNASMDMVARRSGLSKSGLYSHFKNKRDMLRQLFMTEFDRLLGYVEEGITWSEVPEEQLYLAIFSVADYLRSRSEILLSAAWIRTRRLNLGITIPPRFYQTFSGIKLKVPGTDQDVFNPAMVEETGMMILFMVIHTLMRRPEEMPFPALPNHSIRRLFRFIALGMKGFNE